MIMPLGRETHALRELGERVHCHHGAANCPSNKIQVFSPNILPQVAKNIAVELGVHGLVFGDKFMVHIPSNVEKHDEHALGRAAALPRLFRSRGSWALPLRRLLFSLEIIPIDLTLVPSDDPRHEEWVAHDTLTKLFTNCNTLLFLFGGRKPGYDLCTNAVHVQITNENYLHCSI